MNHIGQLEVCVVKKQSNDPFCCICDTANLHTLKTHFRSLLRGTVASCAVFQINYRPQDFVWFQPLLGGQCKASSREETLDESDYNVLHCRIAYRFAWGRIAKSQSRLNLNTIFLVYCFPYLTTLSRPPSMTPISCPCRPFPSENLCFFSKWKEVISPFIFWIPLLILPTTALLRFCLVSWFDCTISPV